MTYRMLISVLALFFNFYAFADDFRPPIDPNKLAVQNPDFICSVEGRNIIWEEEGYEILRDKKGKRIEGKMVDKVKYYELRDFPVKLGIDVCFGYKNDEPKSASVDYYIDCNNTVEGGDHVANLWRLSLMTQDDLYVYRGTDRHLHSIGNRLSVSFTSSNATAYDCKGMSSPDSDLIGCASPEDNLIVDCKRVKVK